jgi:hypothetical protein
MYRIRDLKTEMKNNNNNWELIGHAAVDAGMIMICDPCYFIKDKNEEPYGGRGKTWYEFLDKYDFAQQPEQMFFDEKKTHPGLGVVIGTPHGDGVFPVFVKRGSDGLISEMKICFDDLDEDEDDN